MAGELLREVRRDSKKGKRQRDFHKGDKEDDKV